MHWFQAIAHIGECAADDYTHRIVEIGTRHLLNNTNLPHIACFHRKILTKKVTIQVSPLLDSSAPAALHKHFLVVWMMQPAAASSTPQERMSHRRWRGVLNSYPKNQVRLKAIKG